MDHEPQPIMPNAQFRLEILDNEEFVAEVRRLQDKINESNLDEKNLLLLIKDIKEELNELVGDRYIGQFANVIGEAYFADDDGDLIGGEDNENILSVEDVMYEGISVIRPMTVYEIVFTFTDAEPVDIAKDGSSVIGTYYIPLDKLFKFISADTEPIDNDHLHRTLMIHANRSEDTVQGHEFKSADIEKQLEMLRESANTVGTDVMAICGNDEITTKTDTYTKMSWPESGEVLFTVVDQSSLPPEKRFMPTGRLDGCSFRELIETPAGPIDALACDYPSIVLVDDENELVYLLPIRDFISAHLVQAANL